MAKYVYAFYKCVNYAETSRDADDIQRTDIAILDTAKNAKAFVREYLNKEESFYLTQNKKKIGEIKFNDEGFWHFPIYMSFGGTYFLRKRKVTQVGKGE